MYCLCVNVYCTTATVCQPNCTQQIYQQFCFCFNFSFITEKKAESFLEYCQIFSYLLTPYHLQHIDNIQGNSSLQELLRSSCMCSVQRDFRLPAQLSFHQRNLSSECSLLDADRQLYLLTAIVLIHGGSSTVHIYTQTIHRTMQLTLKTPN